MVKNIPTYPDLKLESNVNVLVVIHGLEEAVEAPVVVGVPELTGESAQDDPNGGVVHENLKEGRVSGLGHCNK